MPLCVWQIHFPALDIRLSYNDIQLFLAIAKSIPTASTPPASRSDTSHTLSAEMSDLRREDLSEKTEAVTGMWSPAKCFSRLFRLQTKVSAKPYFLHDLYVELNWMCSTDMKHVHVNLCMKMTVDLWWCFCFWRGAADPFARPRVWKSGLPKSLVTLSW